MKTSQLLQVTWAAANAGNRSLWNLFTTTKIYKNGRLRTWYLS